MLIILIIKVNQLLNIRFAIKPCFNKNLFLSRSRGSSVGWRSAGRPSINAEKPRKGAIYRITTGDATSNSSHKRRSSFQTRPPGPFCCFLPLLDQFLLWITVGTQLNPCPASGSRILRDGAPLTNKDSRPRAVQLPNY